MNALNRSGIWAALIGTVIVVAQKTAAHYDDVAWVGIVADGLTYFGAALGIAINTRAPPKKKLPPE